METIQESYIGKGVTIKRYNTYESYTIISESKSQKTLVIQRDKATLMERPPYVNFSNGITLSPFQDEIKYEIKKDPMGEIKRIRWGKYNKWIVMGDKDYIKIIVGKRKEKNIYDL